MQIYVHTGNNLFKIDLFILQPADRFHRLKGTYCQQHVMLCHKISSEHSDKIKGLYTKV